MIRKLLSILVAVLLVLSVVALPAAAREIGGKTLPEEITVGKDTLYLNGAGIRVKWFMNIYAIGLYMKNKTQDPKMVINADEPMALKIIVISGLMNDQKLIANYEEGYENFTNGNMAPLNERKEQFLEAHKGDVNSNDVHEYHYVPSEGLNYYKNGKFTINIKGLDYKKAHFGIWLGDNPCQQNLKEALLATTANN